MNIRSDFIYSIFFQTFGAETVVKVVPELVQRINVNGEAFAPASGFLVAAFEISIAFGAFFHRHF
jgi:hypothetical protein